MFGKRKKSLRRSIGTIIFYLSALWSTLWAKDSKYKDVDEACTLKSCIYEAYELHFWESMRESVLCLCLFRVLLLALSGRKIQYNLNCCFEQSLFFVQTQMTKQ